MDSSTPIPKFRKDLELGTFEENGESYVYAKDLIGFALQPISFPVQLMPFLNMFDGKKSFDDLLLELDGNTKDVDTHAILNFVETIANMGYLEIPEYLEFRSLIDDYLKLEYRPPVCAGSSYPAEKKLLEKYIDDLFDLSKSEAGNAAAIIAPHIDFRIGENSQKAYAEAYRTIKNSDADLFVILGTSHYANSGLFMLTKRDFLTPLGMVKTNKELVDKINTSFPEIEMVDDLAHRMEHSIELQLVLLQRMFKDRDFEVLPILTGSIHEYMANEQIPMDNESYKEIIEKIKSIISASKKKVVFIASADFAHIGRKFGDDFDAEERLIDLEKEDRDLIESIKKNDSTEFFNKIKDIKDKNKICGLSPIYSLMNFYDAQKIDYLDYSQWNEKETNSAVSFASLAFK